MAGILFIISAPSGSGKSTLVSEVRKLVPGLEFSVSYTTRDPRGSEQEGVEYHFISKDKFRAMVANDEFLEHAVVFGDNYYGTARSALSQAAASGHDLLLDIDVQGALQVMRSAPEAISLFILPPDKKTLELRLKHRSQAEGVVDTSVIEKRLNQAGKELEQLPAYQYAIVNGVLEQAVDRMRAVILCARDSFSGAGQCDAATRALADSCRTSSQSERLRDALASFGVKLDQQ
jgi:guanylate kinase